MKKIIDTPDRMVMSNEDKLAYTWTLQSNKSIIFSDNYYTNMSQLNIDWDKFNGMDVLDQNESDQMSLIIFHELNMPRYERIKAALFEKLDSEKRKVRSVLHKPDAEYSKDPYNLIMLMREAMNPKADLKAFNETTSNKNYMKQVQYEANNGFEEGLILPIYSPTEMRTIGTSYNSPVPRFSSKPSIRKISESVTVKDWFNEYTRLFYGANPEKYKSMMYDYKYLLEDLKDQYDNETDKDKKDSIAQSMVDLGWNPVANPSDDNFCKSEQRIAGQIKELVKDIHIYDLNSLRGYIDFDDIAKLMDIESNNTYFYIIASIDQDLTDYNGYYYDGFYIYSWINTNLSAPVAKVGISNELHSDPEIVKFSKKETNFDPLYGLDEVDVYAIRIPSEYLGTIYEIFNKFNSNSTEISYSNMYSSVPVKLKTSLKLFIRMLLARYMIVNKEKDVDIVMVYRGPLSAFDMVESNKTLQYLEYGFEYKE